MVMYIGLVWLMWILKPCDSRMEEPPMIPVPDEQRLYRDLMADYESSVRPVMNASKKVVVNFRLSLNQIVDLDERKQVLTTNVFIDQEWEDDNLKWDMDDYNGIRTMRVPANLVWLPDTFIFNNADDGSTGFMNGVYVVLNANGSVVWPVPVKLKSSCHVDITYFPFDDQRCILRFGSWIYSVEWMDFDSSLESVDLEYYIDNSEWELVAIQYEKNIRTYACCPSPHPDLTFTLHMHRRTFYYIFNIIVPCIMLSVLTLLTFWLPTTSGEKISLGLSVFLAFSMFMLLIAEEVPATSKSVPIIGIYLTTVMTMTSVSVIMSVMVINLYNRGYRAQPAPRWLKTVILSWLCRLLRMKHDIERLAKTIRLEEEEEAKYMCEAHEVAGVFPRRRLGRTPRHTPRPTPLPSPVISPASTPRSERSPVATRQNTPPNDVTKTCHTTLFNDVNKTCDTRHNVSNDVIKRGTVRHHSPSNDVTRRCASRGTNLNSSTKGATRLFPYECGTNSFSKYPDLKQVQQNEHVLHSVLEREWNKNGVDMCGVRHSDNELDYDDDDDGPVWKKRDSLLRQEREELVQKRRQRFQNEADQVQGSQSKSKPSDMKNNNASKKNAQSLRPPTLTINADDGLDIKPEDEDNKDKDKSDCNKHKSLISRREIVVEWQTMAMVIDRLLFWVFLLATVVAYVVILFIIPSSKPKTPDDIQPMRILRRS